MDHFAEPGQQLAGVGIVNAGRGTGDRNEHVDFFTLDHIEQGVGVVRRGGFGNAVEPVDRFREPVTGEPVFRRLNQHHTMSGKVKGTGERECLCHLPAGDQNRPAPRRP